MKRFAAAQLERFLAAVDGNLERAARITIIGGSALAMGFGVARATNDIDTFESDLRDVEAAAAAARRMTGLEIPIANSTVAQLPEGPSCGSVGSCPSSRGTSTSFIPSHSNS